MSDIVPQDTPQKQCITCTDFFPATTEYFHAQKSKRDGLKPICKECTVKYNKQHALEKQPPALGQMKICSVCKEPKPTTLEYFHAMKLGEFGLNPLCKVCRTEQRKEKRQANIEEARAKERKIHHNNKEYYKKYKKAHADKEREWAKKYYWANRDQVTEKQRARRATNLEKSREYYKKYEQNEKRRMWRKTHQANRNASNHKRRALKRGNGGTYTIQDVQNKLIAQKYKCYYCHIKLDKKGEKYIYHIDHVVPLSKGGSNWPDNIVIACPTCNISKNDKLLHEWLEGGRLL